MKVLQNEGEGFEKIVLDADGLDARARRLGPGCDCDSVHGKECL
jgi:hypothetical protein